MKKKKISWGKIVSLVLYLAIGVMLGITTVNYDLLPYDTSAMQQIQYWAIVLLIVYAAVYVQLIIHELGHLVFGLLSGYRFCSFRIASFIWVCEDGKLRLKRYSLAGTGGQCLMEPPELVNGKMPVFLYNMGGAIMNLIASSVFFGLWMLWDAHSFLSLVLLLLVMIGLASAINNGIPMSYGLVNNDGLNAFNLRKDPQAMRALWIQLKSNALATQGVSFTKMPEDWFILPENDAMQNPLVAWLGALATDRLMAEERFDEAMQLIDRLLDEVPALDGINRSLLVCDRLYCEILGECRADVIVKLRDKKQMKFIAAMQKNPSVLLSEYAYALLLEKDSKKAAKLRRNFEQIVGNYPYPQSVESALRRMQRIDQRAEEQ